MSKSYSTVLYWFDEDADIMREFVKRPENHQNVSKIFREILLKYVKNKNYNIQNKEAKQRIKELN